MVSCYWQTHEANMPKKKLCFFPPISKQIMPCHQFQKTPRHTNWAISHTKLWRKTVETTIYRPKEVQQSATDDHHLLVASGGNKEFVSPLPIHNTHTKQCMSSHQNTKYGWKWPRQPATFQARTLPPQSPGENHHLPVMHIDQPQMVVATKNALLKREKLAPTTPTLWKLQAAANPRGV